MAELASLVTRLSSEVPARDDTPTSEQYQNCVKDAVSDYGRRKSNATVDGDQRGQRDGGLRAAVRFPAPDPF